ncbi:terminase, partial [Salmonella enterica]|nr:terminase [Salmonella enterica]
MENAITDPRWQDLVAKYQNNWPLAMEELLGYEPTKQQKPVLESAQGNSSMTTVSAGGGTGTTTLAAAILIIRTILYPMS